MLNSSDHVDLTLEFLSNRDNPTILEFGVERGYSTKKFLNFAESIVKCNYYISLYKYFEYSQFP